MENDDDEVVLNYDDSSAEEDVDMVRPEEVQEKLDIVSGGACQQIILFTVH